MSTISIIGSGCMAAAIGRVATKAGHAVELMSRDAIKARALDIGLLPMVRTLEHACMLTLSLLTRSVMHTSFSIGGSLPG